METIAQPENGEIINETPVDIREIVDSIVEPCSEATIKTLRSLDNQIAELRRQMQCVIEGYCGAKGWDLSKQKVQFSFDTGCFTIIG